MTADRASGRALPNLYLLHGTPSSSRIAGENNRTHRPRSACREECRIHTKRTVSVQLAPGVAPAMAIHASPGAGAAKLDRHHPGETLANVVGMQARQRTSVQIHLVDRQLARAFAGAEDMPPVRIDLERPRRLLRRRLADGRQLAARVDRKAC